MTPSTCVPRNPGASLEQQARRSLSRRPTVWPVKVNVKSGRPVLILYFDHNFWAGRFYRETIQQFESRRHRSYTPATYFATDTGDDYFQELMQEHDVWKNRKTIWEKVSQSAVPTAAGVRTIPRLWQS
ncbi:MAG TPA: hypothetical protein VG796_25445 [Verrucomicrobiales bacterium]|nr:hypothetical protein [Verrucomicrobiales bacterium]